MTRIDVVRAALGAVDARRYLEIGVRDGACFHALEVETKVAVDPHFLFRPPLRARLRAAFGATTGSFYFSATSDAFFAGPATRFAPFDVVFVDGLHTFAQSYRDVVNSLEVLADGGSIVVHDCSPANAAAAAPTLAEAARTPGFTGEWNGDVYKTIVRLRTHSDLRVSVLDSDQGVGIVTRGEPTTRLELGPDEIDRLGYEELAADRVALLGLRAPGALAEVLARGTPTIAP